MLPLATAGPEGMPASTLLGLCILAALGLFVVGCCAFDLAGILSMAEVILHWRRHPFCPDQRSALLAEAADIAESLRQFEPAAGARAAAQVSKNVGILRVAAEFRARAEETARC